MSLLVENLSRSFIQKLIKDGNVLVNGTPVKGSCRVKCDDEVVFSVPESVEPDIEPENIPLDILYEDCLLYTSFKQMDLIINRLRMDMVKRGDMMSADDVVDILAVPLIGIVPDDENVVIATNQGEPLVLSLIHI